MDNDLGGLTDPGKKGRKWEEGTVLSFEAYEAYGSKQVQRAQRYSPGGSKPGCFFCVVLCCVVSCHVILCHVEGRYGYCRFWEGGKDV